MHKNLLVQKGTKK